MTLKSKFLEKLLSPTLTYPLLSELERGQLSQDFRVRLLLEQDLCFRLQKGSYFHKKKPSKRLISIAIISIKLSDPDTKPQPCQWQKQALLAAPKDQVVAICCKCNETYTQQNM